LAIIFAFLRATGGEKDLPFGIEKCVTGSGAVKSENEGIRIDDAVESWGPRMPGIAHKVAHRGTTMGIMDMISRVSRWSLSHLRLILIHNAFLPSCEAASILTA